MHTYTCPICNDDFEFDLDYDLKKHEGGTCHCPECDALLLIKDGDLVGFHEEMQPPEWPTNDEEP